METRGFVGSSIPPPPPAIRRPAGMLPWIIVAGAALVALALGIVLLLSRSEIDDGRVRIVMLEEQLSGRREQISKLEENVSTLEGDVNGLEISFSGFRSDAVACKNGLLEAISAATEFDYRTALFYMRDVRQECQRVTADGAAGLVVG